MEQYRTLCECALHLVTSLLIIVHVNFRLLPLASRDATVEHDVNLTVRATLHLRQVEECRDQADQSSSAPDVTALATKISTLPEYQQ